MQILGAVYDMEPSAAQEDSMLMSVPKGLQDLMVQYCAKKLGAVEAKLVVGAPLFKEKEKEIEKRCTEQSKHFV